MPSPPSSNFQSRVVVLFEFRDTDLKADSSDRPVRDETMRRLFSGQFGTDWKTVPPAARLERLLVLAREREQSCRGANDLFGLARCLGNQALIHKARGRIEDAQRLFKQLEMLSRRIEDFEGLAFALLHQATLLEGPLGQPEAALPLPEQAGRVATQNHLTPLANCIGPLIEHIRRQIQGP